MCGFDLEMRSKYVQQKTKRELIPFRLTKFYLN